MIMAAPSKTVWGSVDGNDKGKLGIYTSISSSSTETTVKVEIWFWSKWSVSDTNNNLVYNNSSQGSVSIKHTVDTGTWSTNNQTKIFSTTEKYTRESSSSKKTLSASLSNIAVLSGTINVSTTVTVPALPTYTVTYDANGGSGAPSSQTKVHGTTLKLSSTVPTRTGYTFVGWNTSNTATSDSYYAGGNYTANEGATLYAVWSAIIYKVTYNGNSGTSEVHGEAMSDTATYGQDYETKGNMFEKLGYEFIGWNEKADGTGTDWTDKIGTPFAWNYTNNIVLYAQWEIKANCRVKQEGQHKLGMIYVKNSGQYYPCIVSKKVDGTYKNSTIT